MDNKVTTRSSHQPLRLSASLRTAEGLVWSLFFNESPLIIGRSIHCDLRLPYPWISLQHVEVLWSEQGISARDLYAKTPVRIKGLPLQSTPSSPSTSLSLSFPSLSIDLQLDHQAHSSNTQDKAILTRHLWRPESGWLLWSPDQSYITVRLLSASHNQSYNSPPEPIMPHQWQERRKQILSSNEHKTPHNPQQGQCWFLCETGQYLITHGHNELQITVYSESLTIDDRSYALSPQVRSVPLVLGQYTLAFTQTPHPPTEWWIGKSLLKTQRKRWFSFLK